MYKARNIVYCSNIVTVGAKPTQSERPSHSGRGLRKGLPQRDELRQMYQTSHFQKLILNWNR
jgi:hypothetical protein